jgi:hypothetical protein
MEFGGTCPIPPYTNYNETWWISLIDWIGGIVGIMDWHSGIVGLLDWLGGIVGIVELLI